MYKLFDRVALLEELPKHHLRRGAVGTVMETYPGTDGLEVEFMDQAGKTIAVVTLSLREVTAVSETSSAVKQ